MKCGFIYYFRWYFIPHTFQMSEIYNGLLTASFFKMKYCMPSACFSDLYKLITGAGVCLNEAQTHRQ